MRPPLKSFGGHVHFAKYREWFRSLYCNPNSPVRDILGRLVLFEQYPLDDCAHVCYGGQDSHAYNVDFWDEERAQRIEWIGVALSAPQEVRPDRNGPGRHKYLLYLPPDEGTAQIGEYYCVIVRTISKKTVGFITAYYIDQQTMDLYKSIGPRIYPPPKQTKKKKRGDKN